MGLAEFGVPVDIDTVENMFVGQRPELVANFFKRFWLGSTAGERYIMRHAIRVSDARTRLNILRGLSASREAMTDLYLVAATYDPGRGIAPYARKQLAKRRAPKKRVDLFNDIILGKQQVPEGYFVQSVEQVVTESVSGAKNVAIYGEVKSEAISEDELEEDGFEDLKVIEVKEVDGNE